LKLFLSYVCALLTMKCLQLHSDAQVSASVWFSLLGYQNVSFPPLEVPLIGWFGPPPMRVGSSVHPTVCIVASWCHGPVSWSMYLNHSTWVVTVFLPRIYYVVLLIHVFGHSEGPNLYTILTLVGVFFFFWVSLDKRFRNI